MKRFITLLSLFPISLILVAQQNKDTVAEYYKAFGADCAIFPGKITVEEFDKDSSKVFTPSHVDVNLTEKNLRKNKKSLDSLNSRYKLIAWHLKKYRRQYFGYVDSNGHRMLRINCFRYSFDKDEPERFSYWLNRKVHVFDGEENFWNATFDLTTGKFVSLYINGRA